MNIHRLSLTLIFATGTALLPACSGDEPATNAAAPAETRTTWEEVKLYTAQKSADFRAYVSGSMEELDRDLESFASRTGDAWDATKAELALKRDALAAQLEKLGDATEATWDAARDRTVELYEDLRAAIERARNQPEA